MIRSARLSGDHLSCRAELARPLRAEGPVYFADADAARGSPLAERVFALGGVRALKVGPDSLSITRDGIADWPAFCRRLDAALEEHARSGEPALRPGVPSNVRSPEQIRARVSELLETEINPAVAGHGGQVHLVDVKGASVYLRLAGGCQGCASSTATLRQGIERSLREAIPELDDVVDATDHAAGLNPYYAPSAR